MKIKEFIDAVNETNAKVVNEKIRTTKINDLLKTKSYVGVVDKINLAEKVTVVSIHSHDEAGNVNGLKINSVSKYILHIMGLIELYTDLEIDTNNLLAEYDLLNSNGLIETIINSIGEKEITECQMFIEMVWNDAIQNELTPQAFIQSQVTRFGTLAGATIAPVIEGLSKSLENLDEDKVKMIMDTLGNMRK